MEADDKSGPIGDRMIQLVVKGGIFMYPIIFCSVAALAVFIERLWVLRTSRIIPPQFIRNIEDLIRKKKLTEAVFLCQSNISSIAKIFLAGLKNAQKGMWLVKEAIEERGGREATLFEKNVAVLATIANLTPLLGLLGTVSGMIKSFNAFSGQGAADTAMLAGGIAEALITTATGLCVAVPALICHRFIKDKAKRLVFEMEESSIRLLELVDAARDRE
jgi:biopolymer transport protein ExbB